MKGRLQCHCCIGRPAEAVPPRDPAGLHEGVKSLVDGGAPPGFLIIDDGWQCTDVDEPLRQVWSLIFFKYAAGSMREAMCAGVVGNCGCVLYAQLSSAPFPGQLTLILAFQAGRCVILNPISKP